MCGILYNVRFYLYLVPSEVIAVLKRTFKFINKGTVKKAIYYRRRKGIVCLKIAMYVLHFILLEYHCHFPLEENERAQYEVKSV